MGKGKKRGNLEKIARMKKERLSEEKGNKDRGEEDERKWKPEDGRVIWLLYSTESKENISSVESNWLFD